MDILIKKEITDQWDIHTEDIRLSAINHDVYQITAEGYIEKIFNAVWEIKDNLIIIKKAEDK